MDHKILLKKKRVVKNKILNEVSVKIIKYKKYKFFFSELILFFERIAYYYY